MTQVGLGTVQFGVPYGNNAQGTVMPFEEAEAIVNLAVAQGIRFFDTAHGYGQSEERLGRMHALKQNAEITISTKIPPVDGSVWKNKDTYIPFLVETCNLSRRRLGIANLGLLQFHQCDVEFLNSPAVADAISHLIDQGHCARVGFSVYYPEQAEAALALKFTSALQIPLNVIDDRFITSDLLKKYKKQGIELIARSVFMQGILIPDAPLPPVNRTAVLQQLREMFRAACAEEDTLVVCLRFLLKNLQKNVSIALIGVDSKRSLETNLRAAAVVNSSDKELDMTAFQDAKAFAATHKLLNPLNWNS